MLAEQNGQIHGWPSSVYLKRSPFVLVVVVATVFWWPSLWDGLILLHGDAAHLFIPLLYLQHHALHGDGSLLWADYIFGGHPIFAEGQGGLANPLTIICAYFFEPVYGAGVLHWLCMVVAASGIYRLCRAQGAVRWAAVTACLAVLFSSAWVGAYHNAAMSVTLAWVPWFLYTVDRWFKTPSLRSAAFLATSVALLVTGGYPQIAHGALIYAFIYLLVRAIYPTERDRIFCNFKCYAISGVFAVASAILLSAIQLLPLIELSTLSHRQSGAELIFGGLTPAKDYILGLLTEKRGLTASLGDVLAGSMAACVIFIRITPGLAGHIVATFMLFSLGMEFASPVFRVIYEGGLIPGLHNYRMMQPFFGVFMVGVGIVLAGALTALSLSKYNSVVFTLIAKVLLRRRSENIAKALLSCLVAIILIFFFYNQLLPVESVYVVGIWIIILLWYGRNRNFVCSSALIILLFIWARGEFSEFGFYSPKNLQAPTFFSEKNSHAVPVLYRTHTRSASGGFVFIGPNDPALEMAFRRNIEALSPMSGVLWGARSISGTLALPLQRWSYVFDQINKEVDSTPTDDMMPRLIDILSVRYVAFDAVPHLSKWKSCFQAEPGAPFICENASAKPLFQIFQNAYSASDAKAALAAIEAGFGGCLIIESKESAGVPPLQTHVKCTEMEDQSSHIDIISSRPGVHVLNVQMSKPGWLFVSEANYPGWLAEVNGIEQDFYTAQVLGKAIRLEVGINNIKISFKPRSVYLGAILSIFGVIILLLAAFASNQLYKSSKSLVLNKKVRSNAE